MKFRKFKSYLLVALVVVWSAFAVNGVRALLSSDATLTGNSISVGSADLLISNSQAATSTIYEKTREGFSFSLVPGQIVERYFLLKNVSDAQVDFTISVGAIPSSGDSGLNSKLLVEFQPVDASGVALPDSVWKGGTLQQLAAGGGNTLLDGVIPRGSYQRYRVRFELPASYSIVNSSLAYDLFFIATQKL